MRAERMIKEYPNLKRELSVLEFQLNPNEPVNSKMNGLRPPLTAPPVLAGG